MMKADRIVAPLIEHHLTNDPDGAAILREIGEDAMAVVVIDPRNCRYTNEVLCFADARALFAFLRRRGWIKESKAVHRFNILLAIARQAAARADSGFDIVNWEEASYMGLADRVQRSVQTKG